MTEDETAKAQALIDSLQADDIQTRLRSGFERDFSNSVIAQWDSKQYLSARQLELIEDILSRHSGSKPSSSPGGGSRRYEGFSR